MALTKVSYSMVSGAPVNVLDFGASPGASGSVNLAAIQAAINTLSSNGGAVYIPHGNYTINGTVIFPNNKITLFGEGSGVGYTPLTIKGTTLTFVNSTIGFDLTAVSSTGTYGSAIRDILINGSSLLDIGIKSSRALTMENVCITGCLNVGLWLYDWTIATNLIGCSFIYNGDVSAHTGIGLKIASSTTPNITTVRADKCIFRRNETGIQIQNISGAHFNDCIIESNYGSGLIIDAYERGDGYWSAIELAFTTCHFEFNGLGDPASAAYATSIIIKSQGATPATNLGARYVSFIGCVFGEQTTTQVDITSGKDILFSGCDIFAPYQPATGISTYNFKIGAYVYNTTIVDTLTPYTVPTPSTNPGTDGEVYMLLTNLGVNTSVVNGGPSIKNTWTPGFKIGNAVTGITYGVQQGAWVRNGNLVNVSGYISLTSKGVQTGDLTIINLPFEIEPSSYAVVNFAYINLVTLTGILVGRVDVNTIVLENSLFAGAPVLNVTDTAISDTTTVMFSVVYAARELSSNNSRLI